MRERAAALTGCRAFALRGCWVLVASLVLRAPSGPAAVCAGGRWPSCACCLWCRWCCGRRRARPPARSLHASFARSGRSRSPPVPSGPSGALHNSGAWWLIGGWARRLKARPGPDAAHQHPAWSFAPVGLPRVCLWCRWCCGRRRVRPPARSLHASFARSGRSRSPPVPSGPSGALHNSGAWWLIGGWARRLKARPGPDAAHQHPAWSFAPVGLPRVCLWCRWCCGRRRVRPPARSPHASFARSGRSRSPPVPSGPSGALHTGGVVAPLPACADRLLLHG